MVSAWRKSGRSTQNPHQWDGNQGDIRGQSGPPEQVAGQVEAHDKAHVSFTEVEEGILKACLEATRSTPELLGMLGYESRTGNFKKAIAHLLVTGDLERTLPNAPRSKRQKYRLTAKGRAWMEAHRK